MKRTTTYAVFYQDETQDQLFKTLNAATTYVRTFDKQAIVVEFQGVEFGKGKQIAEYAYNGRRLVITERCYKEGCTATGLYVLGVCEDCATKYGIHNNHDKVYPRVKNEETAELTEGNYIYE